jgi:ATP-dependent Clp protease ATP-binding subunit ClpA
MGLTSGTSAPSGVKWLTERARRVLVLAEEETRMLKHNRIGTEHILLGLTREVRVWRQRH